jgi:hypothetical protein
MAVRLTNAAAVARAVRRSPLAAAAPCHAGLPSTASTACGAQRQLPAVWSFAVDSRPRWLSAAADNAPRGNASTQQQQQQQSSEQPPPVDKERAQALADDIARQVAEGVADMRREYGEQHAEKVGSAACSWFFVWMGACRCMGLGRVGTAAYMLTQPTALGGAARRDVAVLSRSASAPPLADTCASPAPAFHSPRVCRCG